jgi:type VI secretion system protein ImpH
MATAYGPATPAMNSMTLAIREYSFSQALLLTLDTLRDAQPGLSETQLYDLVEFQANPDLGFPCSDIHSVEYFREHGALRARMRLNFLSLSGAGSPLPAFYAEQALGDSGANLTTRMFLDLLNHRLHRLVMPVWRKYRYRASFQQGAVDPFSQRLFALLGLGGPQIRQAPDINWKRLLPYLGLLSLRAHSAALIESVLRYYFSHPQFGIEQWLPRSVKIPIDQRNQLGGVNSRLSQDLVLGAQARDRAGKFRIHVRELSWARFHQFLPTGAGYQSLCALVRFSLRDPLSYDIRLVLRQDEIRDLHVCAQSECRLGWTSWLGREQSDGVVTLRSNLTRIDRP